MKLERSRNLESATETLKESFLIWLSIRDRELVRLRARIRGKDELIQEGEDTTEELVEASSERDVVG